MQVEISPLNRVDGSARLLFGATKVIASVTGPIEPKRRQELPTEAALELIVRPSRGLSSTRETVLEDALRLVLQLVIVRHKYPRQLVQIVVQFLATDLDSEAGVIVAGETAAAGADYFANELVAALNCCFFALVDANVELFTSFCAVSYVVLPGGELVLLPLLKQLKASESHHVVAFGIQKARASQVLLVESSGKFDEEKLVDVIEAASDECTRLHNEVQRPAVAEKLRADFTWTS